MVQRLLIRYVVPHHGCVLIAGVPVQKGLPIKNDAYAHGIQFFIYFGEVSNTYNFTAPNMIVHVFLINILCLACWHLAAKMPRKKSDNIFP